MVAFVAHEARVETKTRQNAVCRWLEFRTNGRAISVGIWITLIKPCVISFKIAICSSRKATCSLMRVGRKETPYFIDSFIALLCTNRQQLCCLAQIKTTFCSLWVKVGEKILREKSIGARTNFAEKLWGEKNSREIKNPGEKNLLQKKFREENFYKK